MKSAAIISLGLLISSTPALAQEGVSLKISGLEPEEANTLEEKALSEGLSKDIVAKLSANQLVRVLEVKEGRRGVKDGGLSQETVAKLSPEQLVEILKAKEATRAKADELDANKSKADQVLIALGFFLFLGFVVGFRLFIGYRQHGQRQETLRLMVEKGAEIPPELLTQTKTRNDLRRGLILIGAGISLAICFAVMSTGGQGTWSVGLIPMLIGAGYLVAWKFGKNGNTQSAA